MVLRSRPTVQHIVTGTTIEYVIASSAAGSVIAGPAIQQVIAAPPFDEAVTPLARDIIATVADYRFRIFRTGKEELIYAEHYPGGATLKFYFSDW